MMKYSPCAPSKIIAFEMKLWLSETGVEALAYLFCAGKYEGRDDGKRPELILLDLKLPRLNGLEVLRQVRHNKQTKLLPFIILPSSDEDKDLIKSYELGANSYIRKPIDFSQFTKAVRQLKHYWLVLNEPTPG